MGGDGVVLQIHGPGTQTTKLDCSWRLAALNLGLSMAKPRPDRHHPEAENKGPCQCLPLSLSRTWSPDCEILGGCFACLFSQLRLWAVRLRFGQRPQRDRGLVLIRSFRSGRVEGRRRTFLSWPCATQSARSLPSAVADFRPNPKNPECPKPTQTLSPEP